ncbi:MAG: hypothetical protein IJ817_02210, partial [Clostridia bacterium]|nr:hypothetical protein [Clostridia bacterium]
CSGKTKEETTLTSKDVYAISVMSCLNYFNHVDGVEGESVVYSFDAATRPEEITDEMLGDFKCALCLFDNLTGNSFSQKTTENTNKDFVGYAFLTTVSLKNNENILEFYFNEQNKETNKSVSLSDDENVSTNISGLAHFNGQIFHVNGEKNISNKNDSSSFEIELTVNAVVDPDENYIHITQSYANNNLELNYEIVTSGIKTDDASIELKYASKKLSFDIQFKDSGFETEKDFSFELKQDSKSNIFIDVSSVTFSASVSVAVNDDGTYTLTYPNNYIETI